MKNWYRLIACIALGVNALQAQIPKLESKPGSNYVIFLDFDGAIVSGTSWNSSYTSGAAITASASSQNNAGITLAWKMVAEDFRPFDLNITTDSAVYNSAAAGKRMWVIITPTSSWFGAAGGVAYLNSFTWTSKTPCWCFENYLAYTSEYIAECISHEGGHTLSLIHQSQYNTSCVKTQEYNPGTGTGFGQVGWAPIMGVGYYTNVTSFYNGFSSTNCSTRQNDWAELLTNNGFGLRTDDYGNTIGSAVTLPITGTTYDTSGIIADSNDVDIFKIAIPSTATISITAKPFNVGASNYKANLDIRLEIQNSSGTVLYSHDPATSLDAFLSSISLSSGNYYIVVDGVGSAYYTDYASVGKYALNITSSIPLDKSEIVITKTLNQTSTKINWEYSNPSAINTAWYEIYNKKTERIFKQHISTNQPIILDRFSNTNNYLKIYVETEDKSVIASNPVDLNAIQNVKVIWNSESNQLELQGTNLNQTTLTIYNAIGQKLYQSNGNIAVPNLSKNVVYFYKLSGANVQTGKFFAN